MAATVDGAGSSASGVALPGPMPHASSVAHLPPPGPPAFLGAADLQHLAQHGHVGLTLPAHLAAGLEAFFGAADAFFRLPLPTKRALYPGTISNTEFGFQHVPDEKQFVTFRCATPMPSQADEAPPSLPSTPPPPPPPPAVEVALPALWADLAHFLFRVLADVGRSLGIPDVAWRPLVQRILALPPDRARAAATLLRVFRYEPESGVADPHADLGLLTLCVGKGRGLQVWGCSAAEAESSSASSAAWRDAPPVTLLVGDTLAVLSTRRLKAGKHRVVANPLGRDSIVFALRPELEAMLDLALFGGSGTVYVRALWDQIRAGRVNVNAQKAIRDSQRKEREERLRGKNQPHAPRAGGHDTTDQSAVETPRAPAETPHKECEGADEPQSSADQPGRDHARTSAEGRDQP